MNQALCPMRETNLYEAQGLVASDEWFPTREVSLVQHSSVIRRVRRDALLRLARCRCLKS